MKQSDLDSIKSLVSKARSNNKCFVFLGASLGYKLHFKKTISDLLAYCKDNNFTLIKALGSYYIYLGGTFTDLDFSKFMKDLEVTVMIFLCYYFLYVFHFYYVLIILI